MSRLRSSIILAVVLTAGFMSAPTLAAAPKKDDPKMIAGCEVAVKAIGDLAKVQSRETPDGLPLIETASVSRRANFTKLRDVVCAMGAYGWSAKVLPASAPDRPSTILFSRADKPDVPLIPRVVHHEPLPGPGDDEPVRMLYVLPEFWTAFYEQPRLHDLPPDEVLRWADLHFPDEPASPRPVAGYRPVSKDGHPLFGPLNTSMEFQAPTIGEPGTIDSVRLTRPPASVATLAFLAMQSKFTGAFPRVDVADSLYRLYRCLDGDPISAQELKEFGEHPDRFVQKPKPIQSYNGMARPPAPPPYVALPMEFSLEKASDTSVRIVRPQPMPLWTYGPKAFCAADPAGLFSLGARVAFEDQPWPISQLDVGFTWDKLVQEAAMHDKQGRPAQKGYAVASIKKIGADGLVTLRLHRIWFTYDDLTTVDDIVPPFSMKD